MPKKRAPGVTLAHVATTRLPREDTWSSGVRALFVMNRQRSYYPATGRPSSF